MVDAEWVRLASDWVQYLVTGAMGGLGAVWMTASRRDVSRRREIAALEGRIDEHGTRLVTVEAEVAAQPSRTACQIHGERLTRVEQAQQHAPSHPDLKRVEERIHARIDDIAEGLSEMKGELHGNTRLLSTIDQYLRDHPRP